MGPRLLIALTSLLMLAGCADRDLRRDLQIADVTTGWVDGGDADGMNKIVPSISLRIRNVSSEAIDRVQINAIFKRVDESLNWGEHFVRAIGADGLQAGASTERLVLRSPRGYTGTEPRAEMLAHGEFVDVKVEIFGRRGSRWVKMGEFPIKRTLLTE